MTVVAWPSTSEINAGTLFTNSESRDAPSVTSSLWGVPCVAIASVIFSRYCHRPFRVAVSKPTATSTANGPRLPMAVASSSVGSVLAATSTTSQASDPAPTGTEAPMWSETNDIASLNMTSTACKVGRAPRSCDVATTASSTVLNAIMAEQRSLSRGCRRNRALVMIASVPSLPANRPGKLYPVLSFSKPSRWLIIEPSDKTASIPRI